MERVEILLDVISFDGPGLERSLRRGLGKSVRAEVPSHGASAIVEPGECRRVSSGELRRRIAHVRIVMRSCA